MGKLRGRSHCYCTTPRPRVTSADPEKIGGEKARQVDRVLDVRQGEACWVVGTVYMEMPLKPKVLDDISKEVRSR